MRCGKMVLGKEFGQMCRFDPSSFFRFDPSSFFGSPRKKAEILADIVGRKGYVPEQCLFLGDAMTDYDAAQAVGTRFWGLCPKASLLRFRMGQQFRLSFTPSLKVYDFSACIRLYLRSKTFFVRIYGSAYFV